MTAPKLPPLGGDIYQWARRLTTDLSRYFVRNPATKLQYDMLEPVEPSDGALTWNIEDNTLNIGHGNGVVQQVGLEQYIRVVNGTPGTLSDGDVVSFSGIAAGNLQVQKFIADGTIRPLYFVGIITAAIAPGETGFATIFGKVRGLDTTGGSVGEVWSVGDVLYASPTVSGRLTNIRPTAPDEVIAVAAVVESALDGEIFVRPTIAIGLDYATFSAATTQTLAATNTGYPIRYGVTNSAHNISVVNDGSGNPTRVTVTQSGYFVISFTNQYTSSNASSTRVHTWLRKNGVDIPATNTQYSLRANGDTAVVSATFSLSLLAGDYLQIMWGADSTQVSLDSIPATAWSPSAPGSFLTVDQTQL